MLGQGLWIVSEVPRRFSIDTCDMLYTERLKEGRKSNPSDRVHAIKSYVKVRLSDRLDIYCRESKNSPDMLIQIALFRMQCT